MYNTIYQNTRVDPIQALMEECNLPIEPLNEGVKDFFSRIIDRLRRFIKWIKDIISKIIKSISEKFHKNKASIQENKKTIEDGYRLLKSSDATLYFNNIYSFDTYDKWLKALRSVESNSGFETELKSEMNSFIQAMIYYYNGNGHDIDDDLAKAVLEAKKFTERKDKEKNYSDTIKVDGKIEYKKMTESLDKIFDTTSDNVDWPSTQEIYNILDNGIDQCKTMSRKLEDMIKLCENQIKEVDKLLRACPMDMSYNNNSLGNEIQYVFNFTITLLSDRIHAYSGINSFNNKITSNINNSCTRVLDIYTKYSSKDRVESNAKFTIGVKTDDDNVNESFIKAPRYSTYYLESIKFI